MADTTKPDSTAPSTTEDKAASPAAAAPIFGAASTFGSGSGFAGFSGLAASNPEASAVEGGDAEEEAPPEEECKAEFKPVVQLEEVEVSTGEEAEETLFDVKSKLYRFDNDSGEWKERGVGQSKLLQHKESQRIRYLFRQEKTLKIRANHIVMPGSKVQEHTGSDKAMVWSCVDFADETQRMELFCIRFASPERAASFKDAYESAAEKNAPLLGEAPAAAGEDESKKEVEELAAKVESSAKVDDA